MRPMATAEMAKPGRSTRPSTGCLDVGTVKATMMNVTAATGPMT